MKYWILEFISVKEEPDSASCLVKNPKRSERLKFCRTGVVFANRPSGYSVRSDFASTRAGGRKGSYTRWCTNHAAGYFKKF